MEEEEEEEEDERRASEAASTLACTATQNHSLPFLGKLEYDTTTAHKYTMLIYAGAKAVVIISMYTFCRTQCGCGLILCDGSSARDAS